MGNGLDRNLAPGQIEELSRLTAFTLSEINDWHAQFNKRCPSGQMTPDDFQAMYVQLFPRGDASYLAQRVFDSYDRDRNGVIDFREFIISVSITSRGTLDEKLRWMFNMYDVDGDESVTEAEIKDMCEVMFKLSGSAGIDNASPAEVAADIFRGLDQNNDHRLSRMEFMIGAKSSPTILGIIDSIANPEVK